MSDWRKSAKREDQVGLIKLGEQWSHAREGDDWKPDKYVLSASIRLEGDSEQLVTEAAEPIWDALLDVAANLVARYPELQDPDAEAPEPVNLPEEGESQKSLEDSPGPRGLPTPSD